MVHRLINYHKGIYLFRCPFTLKYYRIMNDAKLMSITIAIILLLIVIGIVCPLLLVAIIMVTIYILT
jgi:hypothetical protein